MDDEGMAALESSVREFRDELERLRELEGDTGGGEALLVEIELLLATMREEKRGKAA